MTPHQTPNSTKPSEQTKDADDWFESTGRYYLANGHLVSALKAAFIDGLAADEGNPNAPWLTEAHMLCTEHGIEPGHITDRIKALREKLAADGKAGGEVVAWRDWFEQRLLNWRQRTMNRSGDHLALDDFMDKKSLDDLIDYVCSEYEGPADTRPQPAAQVAQPLTYAQMVAICPKELYGASADAIGMLIRAVEAAHGITGDGRGEAACKECGGYGWVPNLDSEGKRIWGPLMNDALPCKCGALAKRIAAEKASRPPQQEQAAPGAVQDGWNPVSKLMPKSGQVVLALQTWDHSGKQSIIRACWISAKTEESNPESEIGEYDEATDTYWEPEGWYEQMSHWDEYSACAVNGAQVTHWMPLPAALKQEPGA